MDALFICHNYENRYNIGNQHFREELSRGFERSTFYGPGYKNFSMFPIEEMLERIKPDIVFFMFPTRDFERKEPYTVFDYSIYDFKKVLYDTDSQSSIYSRCRFIEENLVDHCFLGNNHAFNDDHRELVTDCKVHWLPFGVNSNYFLDRGRVREKEILFLGCTNESHYSNRIHMVAVMKRAFGPRFFFNPSNAMNGELYVKALNEYKIFTSAGDNYQGFFMKYLEAMSCGCLLISQYSPCFGKLGFKNGEHLILYDSYNELIDKATFYSAHKRKREKIAKKGRDFVLSKHTWKHRVNQMLEILYDEEKNKEKT